MNISNFLIGAVLFAAFPTFAQAQSVGPAVPAEQAPAALQTAPAEPAAPAVEAAPAPATISEAPAAVTASAADGVTKEGGKYLKDGRKATKVEIAEYKRAKKAKRQ